MDENATNVKESKIEVINIPVPSTLQDDECDNDWS